MSTGILVAAAGNGAIFIAVRNCTHVHVHAHSSLFVVIKVCIHETRMVLIITRLWAPVLNQKSNLEPWTGNGMCHVGVIKNDWVLRSWSDNIYSTCSWATEIHDTHDIDKSWKNKTMFVVLYGPRLTKSSLEPSRAIVGPSFSDKGVVFAPQSRINLKLQNHAEWEIDQFQ